MARLFLREFERSGEPGAVRCPETGNAGHVGFTHFAQVRGGCCARDGIFLDVGFDGLVVWKVRKAHIDEFRYVDQAVIVPER